MFWKDVYRRIEFDSNADSNPGDIRRYSANTDI